MQKNSLIRSLSICVEIVYFFLNCKIFFGISIWIFSLQLLQFFDHRRIRQNFFRIFQMQKNSLIQSLSICVEIVYFFLNCKIFFATASNIRSSQDSTKFFQDLSNAEKFSDSKSFNLRWNRLFLFELQNILWN